MKRALFLAAFLAALFVSPTSAKALGGKGLFAAADKPATAPANPNTTVSVSAPPGTTTAVNVGGSPPQSAAKPASAAPTPAATPATAGQPAGAPAKVVSTPGAAPGQAVSKKVPLGPRKGGKGGTTGLLRGKPVPIDFSQECVQRYLAEFDTLGMSPAPDLYGAELPELTDQLLAYDSTTGELGGTGQSVCKDGMEPVIHTPSNDAYQGKEKGVVACAVFRQWSLYARRAHSRLAANAPTVEIEVNGVKKTYKRWGVIVGDVQQQNVGYARCDAPLKSSATKDDLRSALEKALAELNRRLGALEDRVARAEAHNDEQDQALADHERRLQNLERRRNWFAMGATVATTAARPANIPFGLQLGWMAVRGNGSLFLATQLNLSFLKEQYQLAKVGLPTSALSVGGSVTVAKKWNNFVFGGSAAGLIAQSVSFEGGRTATHGTVAAFLGAGPTIGYVGSRFYGLLTVPIGVEWEMTPVTKGDRTLLPIAPVFGVLPTIGLGITL